MDVNTNLQNVFQKAKYEPKEDLSGYIWLELVKRSENRARTRLWVLSSFSLGSLAGSIFEFRALSQDFLHSGFYRYFSLVFSNGSTVLKYWKEFSLTLTDSIPVMSLILSLALVFVFFISLRYAVLQFNKSRLSLSF